MKLLRKHASWLTPLMLIMFILQVLAFPFAMGITYAGRADKINHVITYTPGKLAWDDAAGIAADGAAELSLFDTIYNNVESKDKVVAPGTDLTSIIRLKNDGSKAVSYTAVLYEIKSVDYLPVDSSLEGNGFADTEKYSLPKSAEGASVVRAVEGSVNAGEIVDFDINWLWRFFDSDEQDVIDTFLGDKAADGEADDILLGFHIIIEDDNEYFRPTVPGTGRGEVFMGAWGALLAIFGVVLLILVVDGIVSRARRAKR